LKRAATAKSRCRALPFRGGRGAFFRPAFSTANSDENKIENKKRKKKVY
jgi:hypothetical protein